MLLPISLIFAGILLGILLRRTAIPGIAGRIFTPVVVLLLFAMAAPLAATGRLWITCRASAWTLLSWPRPR